MGLSFKKILFLLAAIASVFASQAQQTLFGTISDASTGKPVEYVNVGVLGQPRPIGTASDSKGHYRLSLPSSDSIILRFSFTGYEPLTLRLGKNDIHPPLDVRLRPQSTTLDEVTITDDATRSTTFTHIDAAKLSDVVGPTDGVESLIKTLPDVASNNEMSSQYSVRGGSFDENLVYICGIEIFRPMLIRSGQQEGMSIINPDMVSAINFSPGSFDATYGDKMSSVLDISYSRPSLFKGSLSASLLGGAAHVEGLLGNRFSYSVGFRHHSNRYLFSSLDTKGAYSTAYTDLQALLNYRFSDQFDLSLLTVWTRNRYGLIPESQTTTFGSFMESLELDIYFDGQEVDRYNTLLNALSLSYHPSDRFQLRWTNALQLNNENENYDIQSQYWLYELGVGADASINRFDRGVGTFLEHARNALSTNIFNSELRGLHIVPIGQWEWGAKIQYEQISDHLREWRWVDSAGYAMPTTHLTPGDDTLPHSPILQDFCTADNAVSTFRTALFAQREINLTTCHDHQWRFVAGLRGQYYSSQFSALSSQFSARHSSFLVSPRLCASLKPNWTHRDMLFRLAAGVYQQPPFYREARRPDGSLNADIQPQTSYQASLSLDYNFRLWDKPFKLTTDLYYKYLTDLIPYTIDNLRLRYDAENSAIGYAAGVSLRINGEFVQGLESWASLSFMKTQEDILGDGLGWINRPTDQRLSFKLFLQDYVPQIPWWRMSLNFAFGTGTPVAFPNQRDRSFSYRLPNYFRVDWGNTIQLSHFDRLKHAAIFRHIDDILVSIEIFNLFNHRNVISYIWVSDYENIYHAVPNYLTARQLNLKLTVLF